jgi:hypothetical protein
LNKPIEKAPRSLFLSRVRFLGFCRAKAILVWLVAKNGKSLESGEGCGSAGAANVPCADGCRSGWQPGDLFRGHMFMLASSFPPHPTEYNTVAKTTRKTRKHWGQ